MSETGQHDKNIEQSTTTTATTTTAASVAVRV